MPDLEAVISQMFARYARALEPLWKVNVRWFYGRVVLAGRSAARARQTYAPQEREQRAKNGIQANRVTVTWAFLGCETPL